MRTKKKANEQIKKRGRKPSDKNSFKVKKYKGTIPDGFIVVTSFISGDSVFVRKSSISSIEPSIDKTTNKKCIYLFIRDKFLQIREDQETVLKML